MNYKAEIASQLISSSQFSLSLTLEISEVYFNIQCIVCLSGSLFSVIIIRRLIARAMSEYNDRIWGAGSRQVGGWVMCNGS